MKTMRFTARLAIVPLLLLSFGCGGGNNGNNGPLLNVASGNWQITVTSTASPGTRGLGGTSLTQTGANVSGIMHLLLLPCFNFLNDISLAATVSGQTLQFNASATTGQSLTGTASGSSSSLSGSYSLGGGGCAPDQGTLTATLVPPATGTWQGTLTSSTGGAVTPVSAALTQTGPDAHGFFPLSGTVTFSGSCPASGSVNGQANGSIILLIFTPDPLTSPPSIIISGSMNDPATANQLSGFYSSPNNGCAGSGNVILTKQ